MTDLSHFIEAGQLLESFTNSVFVQSSLQLILKWNEHPYLTMRIFKKIAAFLREMSQDNSYAGKALHSAELD